MKRFLGFTITISGVICALFVLNLIMYTVSPSYHDMLEHAVVGDSNIPVVEVKDCSDRIIVIENMEDSEIPKTAAIDVIDISGYEGSFSENKENEEEAKPQIIDKTYHEDCGNGKGYWVIKYEDGTTSIEY